MMGLPAEPEATGTMDSLYWPAARLTVSPALARADAAAMVRSAADALVPELLSSPLGDT